MTAPAPKAGIRVHPLAESELGEADRIVRLAFGTFLSLPDPMQFMGDASYVHTRWKADPFAAVAAAVNARHDEKLIGTNFATNWGSFSFFGPLTVDPAYWNRGVAQQMLAPTMEIFKRWNSAHLGLYTFSNSPAHVALYQKFGFWPRDLVAVMSKQVGASSSSAGSASQYSLFSDSPHEARGQLLDACREVTEASFDGLDVQREICSVAAQGLGDTVLLWDNSRLQAFAVCHAGRGSEAGTGVCYVKFAAARPGPTGAKHFLGLLEAVEAFARSVAATKVVAGVNYARREAFAEVSRSGFRTEMLGVAMETGADSSGYNRAGVYILDDWR
jgi:GNAT superfamily N-acetyltransferase